MTQLSNVFSKTFSELHDSSLYYTKQSQESDSVGAPEIASYQSGLSDGLKLSAEIVYDNYIKELCEPKQFSEQCVFESEIKPVSDSVAKMISESTLGVFKVYLGFYEWWIKLPQESKDIIQSDIESVVNDVISPD